MLIIETLISTYWNFRFDLTRLELSGLGKRWSSFWRKSSNRKASGDSGGFEFRAFLEFLDAYTAFARRLFYALSGFKHDAHFVPSSFPTVI